MFDSHTHTVNSDGQQTVEEMCLAAWEKGMDGITVTDHADMNFYEERNHLQRISKSIRELRCAAQEYAGRLKVLCGVELGEYLYDPESAKKILALTQYDAVLCSVHLVPQARWEKPYNRIVFSEDATDEEIEDYLQKYLSLLSNTVDAFDFDILAHLTCPVRYITGLHERKADIMAYEPMIRQILEKIIERKIALEFNTGGMGPRFHYCNVQNEKLFALYKNMGGELITLGSDAHRTAGIGNHFGFAMQVLKGCGFTHYHYFEHRNPIAVEL